MPKPINRRAKANQPRREDSGNAPHFLPPFLLGVAAALLLVMIPTIAGFLWMCGDVDFQPHESYCPSLVIKQSQPVKKKRHLLNIFGLRKQDDETPVNEYLILLGDPIERSCRSIFGAWASFKSTKGRDSSDYLCSPKILNAAAMDDADEPTSALSASRGHNDGEFKSAYTNAYLELTPNEKQLIRTLGHRVVSGVSEWSKRASLVPWGGNDSEPWFAPGNPDGLSELEQLDGGLLFYSYLRIMKWPTDLFSNFPFKLCAKGCASEVAIDHTLSFRESYMPWAVSPSTIKENSDGVIFHHGVSPGFDEESSGHSLVWVRPGRRVKVDDIFSTRAYVNALEEAVAASLRNSKGRVGKFNVILDGHNFSWGLMPSLHQLRVFVTMLQDHFPDRLGIIMLTNLGRVGEFVVGIIKPIISEEVRQKIIVLPRDDKTRRAMLKAVVGLNNIQNGWGVVIHLSLIPINTTRTAWYYRTKKLLNTQRRCRITLSPPTVECHDNTEYNDGIESLHEDNINQFSIQRIIQCTNQQRSTHRKHETPEYTHKQGVTTIATRCFTLSAEDATRPHVTLSPGIRCVCPRGHVRGQRSPALSQHGTTAVPSRQKKEELFEYSPPIIPVLGIREPRHRRVGVEKYPLNT